jgi:hypothetical protein
MISQDQGHYEDRVDYLNHATYAVSLDGSVIDIPA